MKLFLTRRCFRNLLSSDFGEMKRQRHTFLLSAALLTKGSVVSLSLIWALKFGKLGFSFNSNSEFSFHISNKTWANVKMMKKVTFFFIKVLFFKRSALNIEILLTYLCLFPGTFILNVRMFLPGTACTAANSNVLYPLVVILSEWILLAKST